MKNNHPLWALIYYYSVYRYCCIIGIYYSIDINPYSAGFDFSRQNLTSEDVKLWRLKSIPALYIRVKNDRRTIIQVLKMNRKHY